MSNFFKGWTPQQVAVHNDRVREGLSKIARGQADMMTRQEVAAVDIAALKQPAKPRVRQSIKPKHVPNPGEDFVITNIAHDPAYKCRIDYTKSYIHLWDQSEWRGHLRFAVKIEPIGAPRQTRADAWKNRPVVIRYREYKKALQMAFSEACGGELPACPDRLDFSA